MKNYESLSCALNDLKKKGYDADFTTETDCLYCSDLDIRLNPDEFHVDEIIHVDGGTNPNDNSLIYAISSATGVKGTIRE